MTTLEYILKKYDLEANNQPMIQIPNVSRLDLIRWCRELDFKIGVEVGVATGEFSKLLVVGNDQMQIYGVDPWEPYKGYNDFTRQDTFNWLWEEAVRRLKGFKRFHFIRDYSLNGVKKFEDNSIDFVYIDANHEEKYVYEDIEAWTAKVRPGGIVSGHDYVRLKTPVVEGVRYEYGVKNALQNYTKEHNISPWFVLGRQETLPKEVREGIRSWAFVKPE